jgi:hypothetical protein
VGGRFGTEPTQERGFKVQVQDRSDNSRESTPAPLTAADQVLRDTVDLPPSAFALPDDGLLGKHLCDRRKALAVVIARYVDPIGSGTYPAAETLAEAAGWDRSAVFRILADLQALGFLTDSEVTTGRFHFAPIERNKIA